MKCFLSLSPFSDTRVPLVTRGGEETERVRVVQGNVWPDNSDLMFYRWRSSGIIFTHKARQSANKRLLNAWPVLSAEGCDQLSVHDASMVDARRGARRPANYLILGTKARRKRPLLGASVSLCVK